MLHLDYEINLDENGEPQVQISKYYEEIPEDKFMIISLAAGLVSGMIIHPDYKSNFNENQQKVFEITSRMLQTLKRDIGNHLKERIASNNTEKNYDVEVTTIVRRNALNYNGIIYEDKIFKREIGLKVLVLETMKVYELQGGIDNENWVEVK